MSPRPRSNLGRILDDLGVTLLEPLHGDVDASVDVGGVVIHDPIDEPVYPERALVLGIGLVSAADVEQVVTEVGARDAAALVVRSGIELTDAALAAADASGVMLLGLARGATWSQLAALLRSLLAEGDVGQAEHESLGGLPSGDLFAVANAIAALLDAPVTIEDRSSVVLAFSGRQEEADASRAETIIGRRVPDRFARVLTERGVFRDLYRYDRPVVVDPFAIGEEGLTTQRVAIGVRAGDEVLGSVWAAMDGPLTPERTAALRDSAKLVALHLLRVRAGADVQRRLSTELVATALEGGAGARGALRRLGLAGQQVVVLGVALIPPGGERPPRSDQLMVGERQRLADAFAVHLSAVRAGSAAALVGDVVYGILPATDDEAGAEERAARVARDFLDRVGARMPALVAVGSPARELTGVAMSRAIVDRVLRVLREGHAGGRVARLADVQTESLLIELRDIVSARGEQPVGPVARLRHYDAEHGTSLLPTLAAWLDGFGDVSNAAAAMFVHPNTFRYRLRRAVAVSGLDLDDPEARFAAMLQLRMAPGH
ncbi:MULTISPECIES: PucR family transcriptional regulator [Microbacterium]|nr:PucR family transcriptional regulator [Microbacterium helvum]